MLRMQKVRARRQRVPAFGEWNYDYAGAGDWPVTQYFDSTMQAGLVVAIPPSTKPPKKVTTGNARYCTCCCFLFTGLSVFSFLLFEGDSGSVIEV